MRWKMGLVVVLAFCIMLALPLMANAEIVDSGTCGDNLTWILDDTGLLTISGTGEMVSHPWLSSYAMLINKVVIENGVTSIAGGAFYDCQNVTSIAIPNTVIRIEEGAFTYCNSLKKITIPAGLSSIHSYAFTDGGPSSEAHNISEIHISNLSAWLSLNVEGEENHLVLPHKYALYLDNVKLKSITIPDGVETIQDYAFAYCDIESITIPDSVTSIGNHAFSNCENLFNISIPDSVTSIGFCAFMNCYSLTGLIIPDGVPSIENWTFANCCSLMSINIPDSVTSIGFLAFKDCRSLKSIILPESVTSIYEDAFSNTGLTKIAILGDRLSIIVNTEYVSWLKTPTIYCNEYSDADLWAVERDFQTSYLENGEYSTDIELALEPDFSIHVGNTHQLAYQLFPDDGSEINWNSSNPEIVEVNSNGIITAHATGSATITLTVGAVSDSVNVTVYQMANSYQIFPSEIWIIAKDTVQLSIIDIEPKGASANCLWSSSNTAYAVVDSTGLVTTKKPKDEAIIVAADSENGIHRACMLHICYPVTAVAFEENEATIITYVDYQATANVTMRTQNCINHLVTFTSSNPEIATIDENGVVHGIKSGTSTITAAAASGVSTSMTVTVRDAFVLQLPNDLDEIDLEAFEGTGCEVVIIPEGCTTIGSRAFANCTNLLYVRIPASVTSIADDAFAGCAQVVIDRMEE